MDWACSMRVSSFRDMQRFMIPLSSKRVLFEPKGVPVDTRFLHHSHDTPKRKAKSVSLWICLRVIYRSMYLAPGCLTCFSAQTTRCSWNCTWRWYTALSGTSGVWTGVWTRVNDMWFDDLLLRFDQRITSTQFIVVGVAGVMPLEEPGNKCLTQPTPNLFFSKMIFL